MSPEAQRIAIAKACGWKVHPEPGWDIVIRHPKGAMLARGPANGREWPTLVSDFIHNLPDYLSDLNAMHEAEKCIPSTWHYHKMASGQLSGTLLIDRYDFILRHGNDVDGKHLMKPAGMRATAAQRAEAFLRTLNLWTE